MPPDVIPADIPSVPSRAPGYREVLRNCPGFRRLFLARTTSLFGDWFSMIAILALLRQVAGSDAGAISGILILRLLPMFLAGPLAGVIADRFSRKAIMIVSDLVRVVLVLGLIGAPATPWPLPITYVLITLSMVASTFFEPARAAALPQLVPDRYLATANALGAIAWSVMFTLGAALGGLVTDLVGWELALFVDAATYIVSAWLVRGIDLPRRKVRGQAQADWLTWTGIPDYLAGLRFIARRLDVATVLFLKIGWGLAGAVTLFLTLFGERVYTFGHRPDLGVAVLYVARAVGTGLGPVLVRRFLPNESPRAMRLMLTFSLLWPCLWYLVFSQVEHWAAAVVAVILAHFGGSAIWVYSTVLLQRMVPDKFTGRVMSTDLGFATLSITVSLWFYGRWADVPGVDLRALVAMMALTLVVPALIWNLAARRWPVGRPVSR